MKNRKNTPIYLLRSFISRTYLPTYFSYALSYRILQRYGMLPLFVDDDQKATPFWSSQSNRNLRPQRRKSVAAVGDLYIQTML